MYKIVNYAKNWSHPKPFNDFKTAFMVQQLRYPDARIEYYDLETFEKNVVWKPTWE